MEYEKEGGFLREATQEDITAVYPYIDYLREQGREQEAQMMEMFISGRRYRKGFSAIAMSESGP